MTGVIASPKKSPDQKVLDWPEPFSPCRPLKTSNEIAPKPFVMGVMPDQGTKVI